MHRLKNIRTKAHISRDKLTKKATLHLDFSGKWALYTGLSIDSIDEAKPILEGEGQGDFPLNIDTTIRSYFKIVTEEGSFRFADKQLPMEGGYNFRDLGGIRAKSGKFVQWGKLFRADDLSHLTDSDIAYLASVPIVSVVDFRAQNETKRTPDRLPDTARFKYPIAITPGNLSTEGVQANLLKTNMNIQMKQMNRLLVSDPACVRAFRILFAILQNNLSAPIVFHCSAGKDRTGVAAALILLALGVDEETVIQDYLLSRECLADKYNAFIAKYPRAEPLFTVKRIYIYAAFNQMKRDHGSILNFLEKELKVDIWKMRSLYLE